MCGIVGFNGTFRAESLEHALQRISHRGPDGSGVFVKPGITGLAHARLSILDTSSAGAQPMRGAGGRVVISYNGEIYNYRELRQQLESAGVKFRGHSDTEVLLNLYLVHGERMLRQLNGIFAFALWDEAEQSVMIARDGLGVKPLYMAETARGVVFGSEIKALLALEPALREPDLDSVNRYLSCLWCPGEGTMLKRVKKVDPGELLWLKEGRIKRRETWYRLPLALGAQPDASLDGRAGAESTLARLRAAVHRQMVSDVPLGAFLSGGLDSSAVVALAREVNPAIETFTIRNVGGQDRGFTDDLPYASRVAKHLGVPLNVLDVTSENICADLQFMVTQMDEPLVDTAPLNVYYISRIARTKGIKVLLSGTAGDDIYSGYRRHVAITFERYWKWLPSGLLGAAESAAGQINQSWPFARRAAKLLNGAGLDGDDRLTHFFLWAKTAEIQQLFRAEIARGLASTKAPMMDFLKGVPPRLSPLNRMLALEQRFFLADFNLIFTDKMSMATGLEVRVPFLDLDLVEHAARLPDRQKVRGTECKWALKQAMAGILPDDVIYRQKTGFGGPVRRWVREELQPLVSEHLSAESIARRGWFEPRAVESLIKRNAEGTIDAGFIILALLCVEIWSRSYLDASPKSEHEPSQ